MGIQCVGRLATHRITGVPVGETFHRQDPAALPIMVFTQHEPLGISNIEPLRTQHEHSEGGTAAYRCDAVDLALTRHLSRSYSKATWCEPPAMSLGALRALLLFVAPG